jgi:hypothetical protein
MAPLLHTPLGDCDQVRRTGVDPSFTVRTAITLLPVYRLHDPKALDPGPPRSGQSLAQSARVEAIGIFSLAATTTYGASAAGHGYIVANLYEISTDRP